MADNKKTIGILGSGIVGQVLATSFRNEGYEVMIGTANPDKPELQKWRSENSEISIGSFEEAAASSNLLLLATNGAATEEIVQSVGVNQFAGKTVIDATNPIDSRPPNNGVLHFFTSLEESLMERLQRLMPLAHLVKAFNSVGNAYMYKPDFRGEKPTMFICGNRDEAKAEVGAILETFGWEVEDLGRVEAARAIEPLCILWCIPGFLHNQWTHAFKLLRS